MNRERAFSLIEVLVALAVFAILAVLAYSALDQIAHTRAVLVEQQQRFANIVRTISSIERDLRQVAARPIRGNFGEPLPALTGALNAIELTHVGFANPQAEARSNLERVVYAKDTGKLQRSRYSVIDRAPSSAADTRALLDGVEDFRLRYLSRTGEWADTWPPRDVALDVLPYAIEFRLKLTDYGEIRRVILQPASLATATDSGQIAP